MSEWNWDEFVKQNVNEQFVDTKCLANIFADKEPQLFKSKYHSDYKLVSKILGPFCSRLVDLHYFISDGGYPAKYKTATIELPLNRLAGKLVEKGYASDINKAIYLIAEALTKKHPEDFEAIENLIAQREIVDQQIKKILL